MVNHVDTFVERLSTFLPASDISVEVPRRERASRDRYELSPVLREHLPTTLADVVVWPRTHSAVRQIAELAYEMRIPITPRGVGTGNYGQAVPLANGLVLDLSRLSKIEEVGEGWMRAGAGARIFQLERAAQATGQELALMPSTVGSTIGGFIGGGSGGAGSIEHGWIWDGFAEELTVVPCLPDSTPFLSPTPQNRPFIHSYGTTGLIVDTRLRLVPAQDRIGLFAEFPSLTAAAAAGREMMDDPVKPRLLSIDSQEVARILSESNGNISPHGVNLRVLVGREAESSARASIAEHGGTVLDAPDNADAVILSLAFNHVTERVLDVESGYCHLQAAGEGLVEAKNRLSATLPGMYVHLDGFNLDSHATYVGILFHPYQSAADVEHAKGLLTDVGVRVNDPHTWMLNRNVDLYRAAAAEYDPRGLLNPGKLPALEAAS